MRVLLSVVLLCALALSGCAGKRAAGQPAKTQARAGASTAPAVTAATNQTLIVTPERALVGKVELVNNIGRFVTLRFPLGKMPLVEQRLNLYRRGVKVGEVKVTGPQREDRIVADLAAGEAEVGDEARSP
jgi:hypothetical protein